MNGRVSRSLRRQHLHTERSSYVYDTIEHVKIVKAYNGKGEIEDLPFTKISLINTSKLAYNMSKKIYKEG